MTTITIDMDKRCKRCGHKGTLENGLCLKCLGRALRYEAKFNKWAREQVKK